MRTVHSQPASPARPPFAPGLASRPPTLRVSEPGTTCSHLATRTITGVGFSAFTPSIKKNTTNTHFISITRRGITASRLQEIQPLARLCPALKESQTRVIACDLRRLFSG